MIEFIKGFLIIAFAAAMGYCVTAGMVEVYLISKTTQERNVE
jgi:hypothetical protein